MNEEREKPEGNWHFGYSALSVILFMVTAFVIFVVVLFIIGNSGWHEGPGAAEADYYIAKMEVENAVTIYAANHNQSLPTLSGTYTNTNCSNCHVVNMSALLTANGGWLQHVPNGLNLSASGNDNCDGNTSLGCNKGSSYIWIVNASGDVFSYCAGAGCETNNSGYQGVWP